MNSKTFFLDRERLHLRFLLEPYIIDISISLYISILDTRENSLCSSKINRKIPFWIFILNSIISNFEKLFYLCGICFVQKEPILQFITVRKVQ